MSGEWRDLSGEWNFEGVMVRLVHQGNLDVVLSPTLACLPLPPYLLSPYYLPLLRRHSPLDCGGRESTAKGRSQEWELGRTIDISVSSQNFLDYQYLVRYFS